MLFCIFFSVWILSQGLALQLRAAYSACTLPASTSELLGLQSRVCRHTPLHPRQPAVTVHYPTQSQLSVPLVWGWLEAEQLRQEAARAADLG